jgi:hypothetical protein
MLADFVVPVVYATLSLAAVSVLGSVTRAQFGGQPGLPPGALENLVAVTEGEAPLFSVLVPFVWWVAGSLVGQLVTRFLGGEGPISAMLAVVGVVRRPLAIGGALVQPWGRDCRRRSRSRAPPRRSPVFWTGSSRSVP